MLKKRNLLFLFLLILEILLLTSCFLKPPTPEGILKGQVLVPEGTLQNKDLSGEALPAATVNIIDLTTGVIIATTTTDTNGYYQVFVPPGGPYLLEALKDGLKLEQITCPVEIGKEYDMGTTDCVTTSAALIVQAMIDTGDNPVNIDCTAIIADSNFNNVSSIVCSVIKTGGDPTESAAVQQAIKDFFNPPTPAPAPTPAPPFFIVTTEHSGIETAGISFSVTITVKDVSGNTVTSYTGDYNITWAWTANNSPLGTAPTKPIDGIQTFSDGVITVTGFTLTNSDETPTITATAGSVSGTSNPITVNHDSLDYIKIENSLEKEVTNHSMTTIDTFEVAAAGYDVYGNFIALQLVDWVGTGICEGKLSPTSDTFTTAFESTEIGKGTITASHDVATDDTTGEIVVNLPPHNTTKNADYSSIQEALDDADSGDTIEVADGTYYENIIFPPDKKVVLQSVNGASFTTINGGKASSVVMISNCMDGTILDGFTIMDGESDRGSGIYIEDSSVTIQNDIIQENTATYWGGGGIFNDSSTLTIIDSNISDNLATANWGGGIFNFSGTLTITGSNISNNGAFRGGGGIWSFGDSSVLTIIDSTISGNIAYNDLGGGGIRNSSILTITNSTISNNVAYYSANNIGGGGIYNEGPLEITGSTISDNAADSGGGIYLSGAESFSIGESGNFNTFSDNKEESTISAEQHISNADGDCHWDYLDNDYSPAEITSYKFLADKNSTISADVEGNINSTERTISLTVPNGTDLTSLIATFTLVSGASAQVGITSQTSGSTSNNFSIPVYYNVFKTSEPSKNTEWTVSVTVSS